MKENKQGLSTRIRRHVINVLNTASLPSNFLPAIKESFNCGGSPSINLLATDFWFQILAHLSLKCE